MTSKLFTPLSVGAFGLRHRVVVEWPLAIDADGVARIPDIDLADCDLAGGLVIYDAGPFIWAAGARQAPGTNRQGTSPWQTLFDDAKGARQSCVTLLRKQPPDPAINRAEAILALTHHEIQEIIDGYAAAADAAKSNGFDGVELDASYGSVAHQFLMSSTNHRLDRYGGGIVQRINFAMELVEAICGIFGRDRMGIRLSPFSNGSRGWRSDIYDELLRSLHDQEIAYVHLEVRSHMRATDLNTSQYTLALRRAFPGIILVSGQSDFQFAVDVVESRWADAACFFDPALDAAFLDSLRRVRPDDTRA
jgi:2,4-dienoyl-CoA reductase-like NADH-dependent reductase (Old Yellow Enzyme family)